MVDDPMILLKNDSVKGMYRFVYRMQKEGKMSSTMAKKYITDYLPKIHRLETLYDLEGKTMVEIDWSDPKEVKRIEKNIDNVRAELKKEGLL